MKKKLYSGTLLFLALLAIFAYRFDDDPFSALIKKFEDYTEKYPQEKVHLHLDKPYYAIGDDIWFKAYVLNTKTEQPSGISKILYVELINERDSLKKQLKLPLSGGISWGDFKLTDSLTEGNYRIRAYTQYMRNAGHEFFFDKMIKVANGWANKVFTKTNYSFSTDNNQQKVDCSVYFTDKDNLPYADSNIDYEVQLDYRSISKGKVKTNKDGLALISFKNPQPSIYKQGKITAIITLQNNQKVIKSIPVKSTSNDIDVQFFPEGGRLIENIPSKIAFKAINGAGLGENITGEIIDQDGNKVTSFSTEYLGMGSFMLNPLPDKTYSARIRSSDGSNKSFKLPLTQKSGYTLALNNSGTSKIGLKILMSADLLTKGEVKVVAQHAGSIYYVSKAASDKQVLNAVIPTNKLPAGIIQFTLFTPENQPVAERLVFVNHPSEQIKLETGNIKSFYSRREKMNIDFNTSGNEKPAIASFSVSVTNSSQVKPDPDNESNILTSLLLTSDLVGYVEKPNHYFLNDDLKTRQELDNLMLTQGWRRFLWKNILADHYPGIVYQPERAIKISGKVSVSGKPLAGGKVTLLSTSGSKVFTLDTLSNAQGLFSFDNLVFNDSTKFVVQARTDKNRKNVQIDLDMQSGQVITRSKNSPDIEVNVNNALLNYIKESDNYFNEMARLGLLQKSIHLEEVKIVEKKNPARHSSNLNGPGNADFVLTSDKLGNCLTLSQCLQGRIAGLIIQNGVPYLIRNSGTPMRLMVDGIQMEGDFLDNINPNDVETIEVLKSASNTAIYGLRGGGGILVITTKRGEPNLRYNRYAPGLVTYNPKGYYTSREFYSPKYDVPPATDKPDWRTTIFWGPQVVPDDNGKASFTFYNADAPGTYRVVIEGIDIMGNLAHKVYTYEVN